MHVVILATRISGIDGVSLEAERWREILQRMGHKIIFVAGQLDKPGMMIPELHFNWPDVVRLHDKVIYGKGDYHEVESEIFALAGIIEGKLREVFNNNGKTDLLIIPNGLSLPMHLPFAVAVTRVVEELKIPTIARHHDFWWERKRFLKSTMFRFFKRWFPPDLANVTHVVINSIAKRELEKRTGIKAKLIWDCFDFNSTLNRPDSYSENFRKDFKLKKEDIIFLQATRIVPRKRIELSIKLVEELDNPKAVLVFAGHSRDENGDYERKIRRLVKKSKIRYRFIGKYVNSRRRISMSSNRKKPRRRIYTLWDCFVNCDFVTYPTEVEGFGNQFVEAMFFRKPIIISPYDVYKEDIVPLGFKTIEMPGKVTDEVVEEVRSLILNPKKVKRMTEKNFKLGKKYLSYEWVKKRLRKIIKERTS